MSSPSRPEIPLPSLRRRQRHRLLVGTATAIFALFILWPHLFSPQHSVSSFENPSHAVHPHPVPTVPVVTTKDMATTTTTFLPTTAPNTTASTAKFPVKRPSAEKRRFNSSAVESLIAEVKKNIKNKELAWLFENCFPNTLDTTVDFDEKAAADNRPDTYVITGDIDAMWLRDSSAQVNPYLPLMRHDPKLRLLIEGVLLRQCLFIQRDPYANAHYKNVNRTSEWKHMDLTDMRPGVHERKWELDSLCYVLRLMHSYWKEVNEDFTFFRTNEQQLKKTIALILQTMKEQQRLNGTGPYTYQRQGEPPDPRGRLAEPNGLIHTFFRPSDDLQALPYLIPSQFFAHHTLKLLSELLNKLKWAADFEEDIARLTTALSDILFNKNADTDTKSTITVNHTKYGLIYAYEIDGLGNTNLMDDSNIPSLLSLPYLCPNDIPMDHAIYRNTRKFIFSPDNPWFFRGKYLEGVGGPHVGNNMVWPLAITMRGLTTTDEEEIRTCLKLLQASHANKGFMHEAANVDMPVHYTRSWFAWANSLFGEFIWKLYRERPHLLN